MSGANSRVALVGDGPAAEAVRAALADVDASVVTAGPDGIVDAALCVAVGPVGTDGFGRVDRAAREEDAPWLAIELGGVAGHPVTDASVAGFGPGRGCYDCLRTRVASVREDDEAEEAAVPGDSTARFAGALGGREAARLLTGETSPVLGGVLEVPHARRRFLPVPGCGCEATPPESALVRGGESRSPEDALAAAETGLDDRVGLVRAVGEVESFPAPYYLATLADTAAFSDAAAGPQAAGVAADWNPAFMKALGEALERYAAGVYRADRFERAAADERSDAVSPSAFVLPGSFPDPDPTEELPWYPGEELASGRPVDLPAEFVVFPPPKHRHRPSITTGLGLGNAGWEALAGGLGEVIERDAAMLAWYSTYEPLGLSVTDEGYETLARRARGEGLEATALLLTQDVDVPVVAACVHREGEWPRFAAGSAAGLDPNAAARGALAEAIQNWLELRGMGPEGAADEAGAIGHYADFPETARSFVDPETTVPAGSVGPDDPPTGSDRLSALIERATDAGLSPHAARLTTRDLDALGFEAVRVLVPRAQPLFTDDPYFGERARTVPGELGFEPRLDRDHHPFP
jgi:ribosomal protein S12 methylthiotransferase accessory factor